MYNNLLHTILVAGEKFCRITAFDSQQGPELKTKSFFWIDGEEPMQKEIEAIAALLSMDAESLKTIKSYGRGFQRESFGHTVVSIPLLYLEGHMAKVAHLALLIGKTSIVSIRDSKITGCVTDVVQSLNKRIEDNEAVTPSVVFSKFFREVVSRNSLVLEEIREIIDNAESAAFIAPSSQLVREIFKLKRLASFVEEILVSEKELLDAVKQEITEYIVLGPAIDSTLRDLMDDINRQIEKIDNLTGRLNDILSLHNINLTSKLTRTMTWLTIIATVVLIPNTVATIFGVPYFPLSPTEPLVSSGGIVVYTWQLVVGLVILTAVLPMIVIRRKGWMRF